MHGFSALPLVILKRILIISTAWGASVPNPCIVKGSTVLQWDDPSLVTLTRHLRLSFSSVAVE